MGKYMRIGNQKSYKCFCQINICFSVEGYSLKYQALNWSGFAFYATYSTFGYFQHDKGVLLCYFDNFLGRNCDQVDPSDLAFSYHAFILLNLTAVQCFIYPKGKNRVGLPVWILNLLMWIAGFLYLFLANMIFVVHPHPQQADAVAFLGYYKCAITFLKYCPQVYWNYLRKTTKGWNMFNIYCDFTGGLCALIQIIFDAKRKTGSLDVFTGGLNITKFSLSICSLCFDTIFLIQHFILYKDKEPVHDIDSSLLKDVNENYEKQKINQ